MLYILLILIIVLMITFYAKLKDKIEIETIKQHNGILLDIKRKLEVHDWVFEQLFKELDISMMNETTLKELKSNSELKEVVEQTKR